MCKQSEFLSFLLSESLFMAIVVDIFFLLLQRKKKNWVGFTGLEFLKISRHGLVEARILHGHLRT